MIHTRAANILQKPVNPRDLNLETFDCRPIAQDFLGTRRQVLIGYNDMSTTLSRSAVVAALKSQFLASLKMLQDAVEQCPDELWARESDLNQSWQIAYHALYFVHLYAMQSLEAFTPWSGQHAPSQNDDCTAGPPDPNSTLPLLPEPYTKQEVLEYCRYVSEHVGEWLEALDLSSPESGFSWYRVPKLEHLFVTLRHLPLHTGQIMERIRSNANIGIKWCGKA